MNENNNCFLQGRLKLLYQIHIEWAFIILIQTRDYQ